jgi:hypothetical protein
MIRHPLLLSLLILLALIAGQGQRVTAFDFDDRPVMSAGERMAMLSPADSGEGAAWAQAVDGGEDGLPVLFSADEHVRTLQAAIWPNALDIALQHAPAYWPNAPPRES